MLKATKANYLEYRSVMINFFTLENHAFRYFRIIDALCRMRMTGPIGPIQCKTYGMHAAAQQTSYIYNIFIVFKTTRRNEC